MRHTGKSFPQEHVRGCELAWSTIPKEKWVHMFINTPHTTAINWYLQAELYPLTTD